MTMSNVMLAFLLSLAAGLSTGIGSLITLFAKKTNTNFLAVSLGFSAGVMVYVSLAELVKEAQGILSTSMGGKTGSIAAVIAFFVGMLLAGGVDKILPEDRNPHEIKQFNAERSPNVPGKKLMRTGMITAVAITIHNFPEGIATFISVLHDPVVALPIVLAIALHNIPEGISVSVPIYYATGSKRKAFLYSFASGLAEPLGAVIGYFILMPFLNEIVFGVMFALVAGIMVFISFDELLPAAREYGEHHLSIYGMVAGMTVMAISLILL